jgi:alpha-1,2-glucosyltransferase
MPISDYVSPEVRRAALLSLIVAAHYSWRLYVNATVPEPYLDEVFHVPQAQAYWEGKWTTWDSKITTPPALYVVSYVVGLFRWVWDSSEYELTTGELRLTNFVLVYMLLVALYIWTAVSRREVNEQSILQREYCILCFPMLFFFSGLYYTDVLSTLMVVVTYTFWLAGSQAEGMSKTAYQAMHLVFGLVSLATRQINIFWVAIFLGGLQIIETLKATLGEGKIHDPPLADAYFEDFPTTVISIIQHALSILPELVSDLWPQLALLASFAGFVFWNGGVVLGKIASGSWTSSLTCLQAISRTTSPRFMYRSFSISCLS